MKVLVTTPYEKKSLQGNTVTAKRVVSILLEAGVEAVLLSEGEAMEGGDLLIALHARKSAHFIDQFLNLNPQGKVIVYLTGTDLYYDIPNDCNVCEKSIELASALVVSQEASLASVPVKHRSKSVVVFTSIHFDKGMKDLLEVKADSELFTVVSHLRAVKQPFMAVESLCLLDSSVNMKLRILGKMVDADSDKVASEWQVQESRFHWLGGVEYLETLRWMKRSVVTINTSLAEGGANSVAESIVLGVPVLASRIEGNIGMLGHDYEGYFSPTSKEELAALMQRILVDSEFLALLRSQVKRRAKRFSRENEKKNWVNLIQSIA